MGREREKKKNLVPNSVHTQPGQENSKKNIKKLKNLFTALFLGKTGFHRPRKIKKNFSLEFRSYSTRAGKIAKKIAKNIIKLKNILLTLFLAKTE